VVKAAPMSTTPWARARWLILAPHPDDETLGAGALISHAASAGRLGGVVYLTDGTGSHPAGTARVAVTRQAEACRALRILGGSGIETCWLGWRDAHPFGQDDGAFIRAAGTLAALCRRWRIDAIAVSDRSESHCDHVAAHELVHAAARRICGRVDIFGYHIWSDPPQCARRIATSSMISGRRCQALRAHRSQLSPLLGPGFRLPDRKLRMKAQDILTLRRRGR
jgi:LmbE family N-acetylglucosaminyl deacetylase